jgi:hypothetical protein
VLLHLVSVDGLLTVLAHLQALFPTLFRGVGWLVTVATARLGLNIARYTRLFLPAGKGQIRPAEGVQVLSFLCFSGKRLPALLGFLCVPVNFFLKPLKLAINHLTIIIAAFAFGGHGVANVGT